MNLLKKKILFVSPYSFKGINGGSILFRELFKSIDSKSMSWFVCSEEHTKSIIGKFFNSISFFNDGIFGNTILNTVARHFVMFGFPFFIIKYRVLSIFSARKAIKYINKESINFLWIYASHSSIPITKKIHKKLRINYHLSIQDDIHTHLPYFESVLLEKDFKYLLENANSIDFISKEMCEYYKVKYEIRAKTMTFIISQQLDIAEPQISTTITKIGYAGNIWCGENFEILLEAIDELNSKFSKKYKLFIYSNSKPRTLFRKFGKHIVFNNVLEYRDLLAELQNCDLLYLPMSFLPNKNITNVTSFPSKIITYLNAKIPILNHSPSTAISHKFVYENNVGYSITFQDRNEIVNFFTKNQELLSFPKRKLFSKNSTEVLKKFDNNKMIKELIELIAY